MAGPRTLDRTSQVPLWAQLLADLRRRLDDGELQDRFLTDRELTEQYGVSRQTARDAVRHLRDEGLVHRERGRGSFVRPPAIEQPLGALYSLFRSVEAAGHEQRSEVLDLRIVSEPAAAAHLGLPADAELVLVARVRYAGPEPMALDRSWLPADRTAALLGADLRHTALYDELASRCGIRPTGGWERIMAALPSPEQREHLRIGARQPVFVVERLAHAGTEPIEWRQAVVRGDRFAFTASWGDHVGAAPDPVPGADGRSGS